VPPPALRYGAARRNPGLEGTIPSGLRVAILAAELMTRLFSHVMTCAVGAVIRSCLYTYVIRSYLLLAAGSVAPAVVEGWGVTVPL
jgi:hypothetical protein